MTQYGGIYDTVWREGWGPMGFVEGLVRICEGAVGVSAPVRESADGTVKDADGTVICYNLPLYWQNKS